MCRRWCNDAGIAITHGARRGVARIGWMSPAKVHVVHNGVCPEQFQDLPEKKQARRQLGLPEDVFLFGEVARFSHGSGLLEIINILKHLPENWHAVLVGDGPLRQALEDQARRQGLWHRLHLPGLLEDVRPAYAAMDAVVLLARYQSFCLMLAEAMLSRVPVVGLQGAGEYTEPEYPLITADHAVFFPRENPWDFESVEADEKYHNLAVALQDIVRWPEQANDRVNGAEQWVAARFSAQLQGRKCLSVYRQVMGNHWATHACNDSL
jgi:glycosyltransferase involved in cell wall biosynthesis